MGLGKGLLGTVTKPVQGVLDFTTGTAVAAKEFVEWSSQQTGKRAPRRLRSPRVIKSVHGTLPSYSIDLATGQEVLRAVSANAKEKM